MLHFAVLSEPTLRCNLRARIAPEGPRVMNTPPTTREIREVSSPTMRGHFGGICKATAEYTTGVWWAFLIRIMDTYQWPLCDLSGEKKIRVTMRMAMAMAMCRLLRVYG
jgi:hypothetical protein